MNKAREQALEYLEQHRVMTLATTLGGNIWAAAVFYVNLNFNLFFLSAEHTRHARHIEANPWVAATIQEDYSEWREIKGIQLEGAVSLLRGDERDRAIERYRAKYPFISGSVGKLASALTQVNWYRVRPARLYFIDNSKGLGHRDEVALSSN